MSLVALNRPQWFPSMMENIQGAPQAGTAIVVDATGEKAGFAGRFWHKDGVGASKSVTAVLVLTGTITSAGGSGITASLQDVNAAAGPPGQPDGTADQSVTVNINTLSNNTVTTFTLGAARTVVVGELLSAVFEFDGGGRLGTDVLQIVPGMTGATSTSTRFDEGAHALNYPAAGPWAITACVPNILFLCSDGTFGTLNGAVPFSAIGSVAPALDTDPDEYALTFSFPFAATVGGGGYWGILEDAATDYILALYEGTTSRATVTVDASTDFVLAAHQTGKLFAADYDIAADTTYKLSLAPQVNAKNVTIYYIDLAHADHRQALPSPWNTGAIDSRVGGGAWNGVTTTRVPLMWVGITALHDGAASGGGGLLTHPGMSGGMRG